MKFLQVICNSKIKFKNNKTLKKWSKKEPDHRPSMFVFVAHGSVLLVVQHHLSEGELVVGFLEVLILLEKVIKVTLMDRKECVGSS